MVKKQYNWVSPTDPGTMKLEDVAQHIEYELARMAIGMLSSDRDAIDRAHRVMAAFQMKGMVGRNYELELRGEGEDRTIYLCWDHPKAGHPTQELELSMSMLTFEGAKNMQIVYGTMIK